MIEVTSMIDEREMKNTLIDLVDLIPFDVQFALLDNLDISIFEVTDVVTAWMSASFAAQLEMMGYTKEQSYATFNRVILQDRQGRALTGGWTDEVDYPENEVPLNPGIRGREMVEGYLFTARMAGYALFTRTQELPLSVPIGDVLEIQRRTLQNKTAIRELQVSLKAADEEGLGESLVAVNAYLNPSAGPNTVPTDNTANLELVIVIAVGVACAAFLFLILAVVWAWRYDRRNRQAYLSHSNKGERNGSDTTIEAGASTPNSSPRQEFPVVVDTKEGYPDSVITEDIATSLSQYYQSGMASASNPYVRRPMGDAASISSMESYGYSLDGYTPSIATPMPSDMPNVSEKKKGDESVDEVQ